MRKIINIEQGVCRKPDWRMAQPVDFSLLEGEQLAIIGRNGSGKTMLVEIIRNAHPLLMSDPEYDFFPSPSALASDNIRYIAFRDSYGDSDANYYLQQRWNQGEMEEENETVKFSSGELRRYQLRNALQNNPRVLIIDNPFVGLDINAREQLRKTLQNLTENKARPLSIILVLSREDEIPDFITHVVEVRNKTVLPKVRRQDFKPQALEESPARIIFPVGAGLVSARNNTDDQAGLVSARNNSDDRADTRPAPTPSIIRFNNISIRYGDRTILRDLSLDVKRGERWALSGENGAGKSTLLSLVCADNPQGYACDIELFGRRRGSGESIWQIKRHIGYVSPEMHRAYHYNAPVLRIVASGLKDSIGLYVRPTEEEYSKCREWMRLFGIEQFADRPFLSLSSGEQRLVLVCRAFVKSPDLLILDEPLHGLDTQRRQDVRNIIDQYAQLPGKTLIMVTHYEDELPPCITHRIHLKRQK